MYKNILGVFRNIGAFIMAELDEDYLEDLFVRTRQMYDAMPEEVKADPFGDAFKSESQLSLILQKTFNCRRFQPVFQRMKASKSMPP